jgi:hypothetical protein
MEELADLATITDRGKSKMNCGKIIALSLISIMFIVMVTQGQKPAEGNDKVVRSVEIYPINKDGKKILYGSNFDDYKIDVYINKRLVKNGTVIITITDDDKMIYTKEIPWFDGSYPLSHSFSMENEMDQENPSIGNISIDIEITSGQDFFEFSEEKSVIAYNYFKQATSEKKDDNMIYTYKVRSIKNINFYLGLKIPGKPTRQLTTDPKQYNKDSNDEDKLEFQPITWIVENAISKGTTESVLMVPIE